MGALLWGYVFHFCVRHYNLSKSECTQSLVLIKDDVCFSASLLTFFSPWLVSQEATLLFPVSSGIEGGFSLSVPMADAFNPSLLSWLPEAGRRRMCKTQTSKSGKC